MFRYHDTLPMTGGKNADSIPQLANVNPEYFGVAVCTIDGQRFSIGDVSIPFCVQVRIKRSSHHNTFDHTGRPVQAIGKN